MIIGTLVGGFVGITMVATWAFASVIFDFEKPSGSELVWILGIATTIGAVGFPAYLKSCELNDDA
jgi:hypothetical protein